MNEQSYPIANTIEEATVALGALASRDGPVIDTKDWYGAELAQFSDARKTGWPLLDLAVRPTGNANVIIQLGVDDATFTDWLLTAAAAGAWTPIRERIPGRFARVRLVDTSNAANSIYLWTRLASQ